ncbi:50S ribosomal protein L14 [Cordyceps militaris CM01]|uniref:50S ribosomal protein L14 n=1 Tax=Cordyceps militaris (strain CM01) TaxID=983644 RepID=G3JNL9_CORMM|nr:50S ribosomal protein L14 [Cordyceps militaris CM01]EGX89859.1 50S ribosomal protein L14 [Cordyceps militaris CM01]
MIQLKTILNCIDNSGAALVECVLVVGQKRHARIGTSPPYKAEQPLPRVGPTTCEPEIEPRTANPSLGDRIVVVVQEHRTASSSGMSGVSNAAKVKRGDMRHAVVVRTKYPTQRRDGSVVRFDDNACVLLNKAGDPVGSRINGVVGAELRRKKWSKILSMAPMQA